MFKEPEKLIKSPMDMGKFQRSEGYRKGLLLYYSILVSIVVGNDSSELEIFRTEMFRSL